MRSASSRSVSRSGRIVTRLTRPPLSPCGAETSRLASRGRSRHFTSGSKVEQAYEPFVWPAAVNVGTLQDTYTRSL